MMQNSSNHDDTGMGPAYVAIAILISCLFIYWYFHDNVIRIIFMLRRFELSIIMLWNDSYLMLMNWCNHVLTQKVTLVDLKYLSYSVAYALSPIYFSLGVLFILLLWLFHPSRRYRQEYNMRTFSLKIRESFERVFLPHEKKASLLNDKKSLALKPIEYIKYYKLAKSKKIDEIAVSICMQTQLGNKWQNSSNIPWAHYGLFAAFCSYCMKDRQLGENILNLLNKHYSYSGKISKKHSDKQLKLKVERAISQYGASEMIGEKIHRHYYVTTLLVELLFIARQDGSLACSNFLWLKSIDRALWYGLNNLGRKTYFCEGIAIITHWQAEKSLSTRLKTPMLHNVIAALKQEYSNYL